MAKKDEAQTDDILNGAPSDQALHEEVDAEPSALKDELDEVKEELDEALNTLRYEVAKLRLEEARTRARTWVEDNPTVALALAMGAGIVLGRILGEALKPSPPPPAWRSFGQRLTSQARHLGDRIAEQAVETGREFAHAAGTMSHRARKLGDDIAHRAEELADMASSQTTDLQQNLSAHAERTASTLKDTIHQQAHRADPLLNAVKTVTTALALKKVADWFRRIPLP